MKTEKKSILGKELRNASLQFRQGMKLTNSDGNIDSSSLGYQYAIQTTTFIRERVVEQKFYQVPIADFVPVDVGVGAWMEDIKTNLVYDIAGDFESGLTGVSSGPSEIATVDVATAPKNAKLITWQKGYRYAVPEVAKALASNNWDLVSGKMSALKKNWDLGVQKIAFLGLQQDLTNVPGLLTSPDVTINTAVITKLVSSMNSTEFQALVSKILAAYALNANYTAMPNVFVMPLADYLGLGAATASGFPIGSMLDYLTNFFKQITGEKDFKILPLAYAQQAQNAGYINGATGKNRYVLYRKDPETIKMDIPVDFTLNPAGTSDNYHWQGIACGQLSGAIFYRPAECLYFDFAS
jgi:hypothetical protein